MALLLETLDSYAEVVTVTTVVEACRDAKDNFLLSLAEDGKAGFLLTGDSDLLALKAFRSTKILTLAAFLSNLKN